MLMASKESSRNILRLLFIPSQRLNRGYSLWFKSKMKWKITKINLKLLIYLGITNRQFQEASIWTRQGDRHSIFLKRTWKRFIVGINLQQSPSRTCRRGMVVRIFWTNLKICKYWGLSRSRRLLRFSRIKAKEFHQNWLRLMSIGIACLS